MAFALSGDLSSPSVILFNIKIAFAADGDNICLPIVEVLLCTKKQRDWTSRNAVLLPPFLTEAATLHSDSDAGELLKIFACYITEWASNADSSIEADDANCCSLYHSYHKSTRKNRQIVRYRALLQFT